MKISVYELLGLVKDGKASDITTNFMFDRKKYNLLAFLDEYTLDINSLNWEIEILEEEKKIPEKLNIEDDGNTITLYGEKENEWTILDNVDVIVCNKINSIIDYLKSKGDDRK